MTLTPTRRVEVLLALAVLLLTGFVIHPWSAQPASRYTLTVAAVDDHTMRLDRYEDYLGLDQAHFEGHTYSDKAPYQPLLGAPAYQVYRWAGGDPFPAGFAEGSFHDETNYGLWWVTLWTCVLPTMALIVLLRRTVARTHPELATKVALAVVLATTVLPFSGWLFGHALGALAITAAWYLLQPDGGRTPARAAVFGAGVWLGVAIGAEYAAAAIALVVLVHVLARRDWRDVGALAGGTVLGTVPLLIYNWVVFHNPFEVSYQGHLKSFEGEGAFGVYNLTVPDLDEVTKTLFGNRGLFVITPIVLLAVVGAVLAITRHTVVRRTSIVALAALVAMLIVSTGIDGYGGDSPGPRYLIPAIPLLAAPLADMWRRVPLVCTLASVIGATIMSIAMLTNPAVDTSHPEPLRVWIDALRDGDFARNVLTGTSGDWALLLTFAAGLGCVVAALATDREPRPEA